MVQGVNFKQDTERRRNIMTKRKTLFVAALAIVCIFVLAVDSFAGNPGFNDKEIRIAQFSPQTGPAAPWDLSLVVVAFYSR